MRSGDCLRSILCNAAFSVFKIPMTKLIGITDSAPDDWEETDLFWWYVFLSVNITMLRLVQFHPLRGIYGVDCCYFGDLDSSRGSPRVWFDR